MSPEAQRIAIAEEVPNWRVAHGGKYCSLIERNMDDQAALPGLFDPLSDLNAMHEAEDVLDEDQWKIYAATLEELFVRQCVHNCGAFTLNATAAQRAEAFLRTLGKWDDSK